MSKCYDGECGINYRCGNCEPKVATPLPLRAEEVAADILFPTFEMDEQDIAQLRRQITKALTEYAEARVKELTLKSTQQLVADVRNSALEEATKVAIPNHGCEKPGCTDECREAWQIVDLIRSLKKETL